MTLELLHFPTNSVSFVSYILQQLYAYVFSYVFLMNSHFFIIKRLISGIISYLKVYFD